MLLCLEPIGEQVEMAPGLTYEVVTTGGDDGVLEIFLEESKVIVYGWNNSDSAVFQDGRPVTSINFEQGRT